jgi:predicted nucleic acid-binding protein
MSFQSKYVYLDTCALCRQFDEQTQERIALETQAVKTILNRVYSNGLILIISKLHHIEIEGIKDRYKRDELLSLLREYGHMPQYDLPATRIRAEYFITQGLKLADATHVAFAEQVNAYFVTTDDRLIKGCHRLNLQIKYGTPLDLFKE